MDISGMESGTQENVGGMPAGDEPYNPSGQAMPTDGGTGSSASPAPGPVASPGSDDYVMQPNVSGSSEEQVGRILGGPGPSLNQFANMPTPDNQTMTPYRERREKGFYNSTGEKPQSTTTSSLAGLGAPQKAEPRPVAKPAPKQEKK